MIACNDTEVDCSAVLCAGTPALAFQVLADNENVFLNNTYTIEDVSITGENSTEVTLSLGNSTEPESILILQNPSWVAGNYEYNLVFGNNDPITLLIDIVNSESDCCGNIPRLRQLTIDGDIQDNEVPVNRIILD